jgi:hypothetical protein
MSYAILDVRFHDHPKIMELLDEPDALAAIGLWTLCLAWAKDHADPDNQADAGHIPASLIRRLGGSDHLAALLTKAGLWEQNGTGWVFHDFAIWQQLEAWRVKRDLGRKGGRPSNKSRSEPSANHMAPHEPTMRPPISQSQYSTEQLQDKTKDQVEANASTSSSGPSEPDGRVAKRGSTLDQPGQRTDVERLCHQLADAIVANGCKRPVITKAWRDAARLLIDKDGRTEAQISKAITFATTDEFWRANILSMPTLRAQYDKLRLAAQRGKPPEPKPGTSPRDEYMRRR